ncbi:hypothetical protein [Photobacterium sp.]|uniref:hypothetical protein n=1 Tax=Photobacterium sp. TaxID=660 RepID=UPI00299E18F0|nr:hypothetical protein [Photobacterium sp.]MDX1303302.1 hypothetical protein [Photobacterium sp.]
MKRYLLSIVILASSSAYGGSDYDACIDNSKTELCQAYLTGLSHGKAAVDSTAMVEQDDSYRSRALEQRVGERYRKTVQMEKKSVQMEN